MKALKAIIAAAATLAAALLTGSPAEAVSPAAAQAEARCVVTVTSCNSSAIAAGSDGAIEFAAYSVTTPACVVNIRDMTLNPTKQIYSQGFTLYRSGRITGLTNTYRVELRWCTPGDYARIW